MTKKILETLNLPPMESVFADHGPRLPEPAPEGYEDGSDHARKMDQLHRETLQHAADLMEFGYNAEPNRSRGLFEIAAAMYGRAIEAANSKRDAQLKTLKLALDQRRLDLDEMRAKLEAGQAIEASHDATIIFEDRNALLLRLADQAKKN